MALTAPALTAQLAGTAKFNFGVVALAACFQGGIAMLASGSLRPARQGQGADNAAKAVDAALCRVVGIFEQSVTGGAVNNAVSADVTAGPFVFKNSAAGDAITLADVGRACFIIDDETVAKTNPNATRPVAGVVLNVDAAGVHVSIGALISAALTA